jgi:hypothetical protein
MDFSAFPMGEKTLVEKALGAVDKLRKRRGKALFGLGLDVEKRTKRKRPSKQNWIR